MSFLLFNSLKKQSCSHSRIISNKIFQAVRAGFPCSESKKADILVHTLFKINRYSCPRSMKNLTGSKSCSESRTVFSLDSSIMEILYQISEIKCKNMISLVTFEYLYLVKKYDILKRQSLKSSVSNLKVEELVVEFQWLLSISSSFLKPSTHLRIN